MDVGNAGLDSTCKRREKKVINHAQKRLNFAQFNKKQNRLL